MRNVFLPSKWQGMLPVSALAAACAVIATSATAADVRAARPMPVKVAYPSPAVNWSGFYAGVNLGGGFAQAPSNFSFSPSAASLTAPNSPKGVFGGVQAGHNWQTGSTVLGVEGDFQFADINGRLDAPCALFGCGAAYASYGHTVDWFGTVRGRIGHAFDALLVYATGGYAFGHLQTTAIAGAGPAQAVARWSHVAHGWAAGAGAEYAFAPRWSVKAEYLYTDLGKSVEVWSPGGLITIRDSTQLDMHTVRAGMNYRF